MPTKTARNSFMTTMLAVALAVGLGGLQEIGAEGAAAPAAEPGAAKT